MELYPTCLDSLDHSQLPSQTFTTCVSGSPGDYISQPLSVISPLLLYTALIFRPRTSLQVQNISYKCLGTTEFHFPFLALGMKQECRRKAQAARSTFSSCFTITPFFVNLSSLKASLAFVLQAAAVLHHNSLRKMYCPSQKDFPSYSKVASKS